MKLLAVDPGPVESALLIYSTSALLPVTWSKVENDEALRIVGDSDADALYVEMIASYGMPVGKDVFETCVWIGRFMQRWKDAKRGYRKVEYVYRREVKLHLCDSARAKDANVRAALLDRYGGREAAVGRKASPGPLYGLTGDCWSALGVAVTAAER